MRTTFNIDADVIQADWLRVVTRMRVLRALRPDITDAEVRIAAEGDHLASLRRSTTAG